MRYLMLSILTIVSLSLYAQSGLVKNADNKLKGREYDKAIELYRQAYAESPENYHIIKNLALANQRIENLPEAEAWMEKLFLLGRVTSGDYLMYAEILLANGKYIPALKYLDEFDVKKPGDKRSSSMREQIEYIRNLIKDSLAYQVFPFPLNTPGSELGTCFYNGGIIFSSSSLSGSKKDTRLSAGNLPFLDLYYAKNTGDGGFGTPSPFAGKLKTAFNDGPVSFDPVENCLYITRFAPEAANLEQSGDIFHLQVVVAEMKNGDWDFKEDFFVNSPNYSVAQPSVSTDGRFIYFASDMPGGYGAYDIYFCYKEGGKWSAPFNLGPVVNSKGNERFPFISSEGLLYFSSDSHPGLGGLDIFVATPENGVFNSVRNAGYPVNSTRDDIAFVLDNSSSRGYFSSNRKGGLGYYDIYSVMINFVPVTIKGTAFDFETKSALPGVLFELFDPEGKKIGESVTKADGTFICPINKIPEISLSVQKDDFIPIKKKVAIDFLKPNEELKLELFLRKK